MRICAAAGYPALAWGMSRAARTRDEELLPTGVELLAPGTARGLVEPLRRLAPAQIVVCSYDRRLPEEVLSTARDGSVNVHFSLLPRWRGAAPLQHAVLAGDLTTGVTAHRITDRYDSGPILARSNEIQLGPWPRRHRLQPLLDAAMSELLPVALRAVTAGEPGQPQQEQEATDAPMLTSEIYTADWSSTAHEIHGRVRLLGYFSPLGGPDRGPVAELDGQRIRLLETSLTAVAGAREVRCADGPLWILRTAPVQSS
ncbi:methionyl-tRNA formyltransferase [Crossiella equi]|uniref:Methionyl-tRNA formyltransferase n=1 Tax=Crossiella equi TaxID=130796 RepID=A0ABS5AN62_9PSEU|nr:formyltransferase family protein [Crossiella equi]MBP2477677.1 methionyl-tRNA formyltransferase [Crossiella equi]